MSRVLPSLVPEGGTSPRPKVAAHVTGSFAPKLEGGGGGGAGKMSAMEHKRRESAFARLANGKVSTFTAADHNHDRIENDICCGGRDVLTFSNVLHRSMQPLVLIVKSTINYRQKKKDSRPFWRIGAAPHRNKQMRCVVASGVSCKIAVRPASQITRAREHKMKRSDFFFQNASS